MSTTENLSEGGTPAPRPVVVEVLEGPSRPAPLERAAGSISVGSHPQSDLVLADPAVSRHHARLELLGDRVRVVDLGSTNGVRYLGARVREVVVPLGAEFQLGRSVLRVRAAAADEALGEREELGALRGRSAAMRKLYAQLEKLAAGDANVLVLGETGVGKTAAAQTLHGLSPRAKRPFVVFDCGTINPNLIEAALFGHVKGAFTGADESRAGALDQALDGTLLLDELGELPLELQPKLLRALDARVFSRVGEHAPRRVRCRFVAATQRDLEAMVAKGQFRADLYFRVAQTVVQVPPLRERRDDVPLLVRHFAASRRRAGLALTPATVAALQAEPWPGNVRELANAVERALTLGDFRATQGAPPSPGSFSEARDEVVRRFERDYVVALLEEHGGNLSAAARAGGLARSQLYRLLERHQLKAPEPD